MSSKKRKNCFSWRQESRTRGVAREAWEEDRLPGASGALRGPDSHGQTRWILFLLSEGKEGPLSIAEPANNVFPAFLT